MDIEKLKKDMYACLPECGDIPTQQQFETVFKNLVKVAGTHVRAAYDDGHAKGLVEGRSIPDQNNEQAHDEGYRKGLAEAQLLADNAMVVERSRQGFMTDSSGIVPVQRQ